MQQFFKNQIGTSIPQEAPKIPVAVKLKDGTILSLSDLPPANTKRWVASAKAQVVRVFMAGLITKKDVIKRYDLSEEEFESWLKRYIDGGKQALKATKLREFEAQ